MAPMLLDHDKLEARDLYHVDLLLRENVVASALGHYLCRANDP